MIDIVTRRDTCRLCGGRDHSLALPLASAPIIDDYVSSECLGEVQSSYLMDVYLCHSCGHAQLLDVVDPGVLYGNYIYETTSSPGLVQHFEQHAKSVIEQVKPAPDCLVVDIGSNDGSLLRFFQNSGLRVLGVDPAPEIAKMATASGVETIAAFFTTKESARIKEEHGPAGIITANNLFANVDDLDELTRGIQQLLAPDGVFVIETFYMVDLMKNMVFDFLYHEHLSCFTVKPLAAFFQRHGMQLIHVEQIPTKGGSMRLTVQLADGPRQVHSSVAEFIAAEDQFGAQSLQSFSDFAAAINRAKQDVVGLIQEIKASGKTVAGYGASATTTCMIYHFGIGEQISFLVDDSKTKQGRFSPGHHIPVLPPQALYERNPEYVLVFAWRFSEAILKNHRAYLDQGGHFVLPLPNMKVL